MGQLLRYADRKTGVATSVVNGKIYAIGGDNKFGPCLSTVEEYDPVKDTWTRKADMPTARASFSTCVVNGEVYAIGGFPINAQAWKAFPTVEVYNPANDKWMKRADMITARASFASCMVNGRIYAIGGESDPNTDLPIVEVYDPATDKWMEKAGMPTARGCLSASEVGGKIYAIGGLIGGWAGFNLLSTVEEYTPEGWPFSVLPSGKLQAKWGEIKSD